MRPSWWPPRRTATGYRSGTSSEEPVLGVVDPPQGVVVDDGAGDPAVGGQDPGLGLDLLGGEDAADRTLGGEQRLAVEQLEVAGQLFDPVDLAAALDLDRHAQPLGVTAHQVHRADRGRELPTDQREP